MGGEELPLNGKITRDYGSFKIIGSPATHTAESIAYRVEGSKGASIVYSGDTGYCEEIVDLARGSDLLTLESSFPDGQEVEELFLPVPMALITRTLKEFELLEKL